MGLFSGKKAGAEQAVGPELLAVRITWRMFSLLKLTMLGVATKSKAMVSDQASRLAVCYSSGSYTLICLGWL